MSTNTLSNLLTQLSSSLALQCQKLSSIRSFYQQKGVLIVNTLGKCPCVLSPGQFVISRLLETCPGIRHIFPRCHHYLTSLKRVSAPISALQQLPRADSPVRVSYTAPAHGLSHPLPHQNHKRKTHSLWGVLEGRANATPFSKPWPLIRVLVLPVFSSSNIALPKNDRRNRPLPERALGMNTRRVDVKERHRGPSCRWQCLLLSAPSNTSYNSGPFFFFAPLQIYVKVKFVILEL